MRVDPAFSIPKKVRLYWGINCSEDVDIDTNKEADFVLVHEAVRNSTCFAVEVRDFEVKVNDETLGVDEVLMVLEIQLLSVLF